MIASIRRCVISSNLSSSLIPRQMKSNIVSVTPTPVSIPLTALPTAKIVRHPKAKKTEEEMEEPQAEQPDEETCRRLNAMARQHPFFTRHRGNNHSWLL